MRDSSNVKDAHDTFIILKHNSNNSQNAENDHNPKMFLRTTYDDITVTTKSDISFRPKFAKWR